MDKQQALTSTAMLAALWNKEKKDSLELIVPFVIYSINQVASCEKEIISNVVSDYMTKKFGFYHIPNSVMKKVFNRLVKRNVLFRKNKTFYIKENLSDKCNSIDMQLSHAKKQTDIVINSLTTYLNNKKEKIFKKDFTAEDAKKHFVEFLESKGYFVFSEVFTLAKISPKENTIYYNIAQFILSESEKKTETFTYIHNIVTGLFLSNIIYGYTDTQFNQKANDVSIYLDTTLLLEIFGFKGNERNTSAKQLVEILNNSKIPLKCFSHNYSEVYKIIDAYKFRKLNDIESYKKIYNDNNTNTLEYFDKFDYSPADVGRVLINLEEYFKKYSIEIVDTPSLSEDGSGKITSKDFKNSIGEQELKIKLSSELFYKNDEALNNDVSSVASVFTLRRGREYSKIEECKAIFTTSNLDLVNCVNKTLGKNNNVPLIISDLDLTTILWVKNYKKYTELPALKLVEFARVSLEPTQQICDEFVKQVEKLNYEVKTTNQSMSNYKELIYTEKEKIMELIDGNIENIENIKYEDLEQLERERVNKELNEENNQHKKELETLRKKIHLESNTKINNFCKNVKIALYFIFYCLFALVGIVGVLGLLIQNNNSQATFFSVIFTGFSLLGILDIIISKFRLVIKLVNIIVNKVELYYTKKEELRIKKLY